MRILATADLHGKVSAFEHFAESLRVGQYDAGIMAGDLMTHFSQPEIDDLLHRLEASRDDLLDELPAVDAEPGSETAADRVFAEGIRLKEQDLRTILSAAGVPIYFVMGNDDGIVAGGVEWRSGSNLHNVNQRRVRHGPFNVVGYHYTNPYVTGLFEKPEEEQAADLAAFDELVDSATILVTHGPPYGTLDQVEHNGSVGSRALRAFVDRCPPFLHVFGHIHQAYGISWPAINVAYPLPGKFVEIDARKCTARWV